MTLHLTYSTRAFALHVSDRLVTLAGSLARHDPHANKCIIYFVRDAVVSMGYAGLAYIDEVPTDQWIVERLCGQSFSDMGKFILFQWEEPISLDLGQSVERLRQELNAALRPLRSRHRAGGIDIVLAGWQWTRNRGRPTRVHLRYEPGAGTYVSQWRDRWWHLRPGAQDAPPAELYAVPPGYLSDRQLQELLEGLQGQSPDHAEQSLVNIVRAVGQRSGTVGEDCMSVLIVPAHNLIRVRYLASDVTGVLIPGGGSLHFFQAAFTPWVLAPKLAAGPSVLNGPGPEIGVGRYRVVMEGLPPDPTNMSFGLITGQIRQQPPQPRRLSQPA